MYVHLTMEYVILMFRDGRVSYNMDLKLGPSSASDFLPKKQDLSPLEEKLEVMGLLIHDPSA
jgi:phosphoribosyl 1,2-cyclic phosphodiesterase